MDKRQRARGLWEESGGTLPLKEIAAKLGVAEGTLRQWKRRDGWGKKCNVTSGALHETEVSRQRRARTNRKAAELIDANDELTDREKDFCLAMVHAPNATQAALLTGRYKSYSSAQNNGNEMMAKPAVRREVERIRAMKRAARLADGDDIVDLLERIIYADIRQAAEFKGRSVKLKDSKLVDGTIVTEVRQGRDGISVKLADKLRAVELYYKITGKLPMDQHKKSYDKARLMLDDRAVKVQEDKLQGMSSDVETIKEGLQGIIDVINSPVPDRRLDDE